MISAAPGVRVYVAAPYDMAPHVRAYHERLRGVGCHPVSQWAACARGPDNLEVLSRSELLSRIEVNDAAIEAAHVVVVFSRRFRGGETFAEAARAIIWGKPVLWCGEHILTTHRAGVYLCHSEQYALDALAYVAARTKGEATRSVLATFFRLDAERALDATAQKRLSVAR